MGCHHTEADHMYLCKNPVFITLSVVTLTSFVFPRRGCVGAGMGVRSLASVPSLPSAVADFVKGAVAECQPARVHVVTGTAEEASGVLAGLEKDGMVKRLPKYHN